MSEEENLDSGLLGYLLIVIFGAAILYGIRRFFKGSQFTENTKAKGKVILVTGGSAGIGKQLAREINLRGGKVYLLCRNRERGNAAVRDIVTRYGCDATRLIILSGDLADFGSIKRAVVEFGNHESKLDILINNAGIWNHPKFETTIDGHELTWQSNHLGHFLLTELLLPKLRAAESSDSGARIVILSSKLHTMADSVDPDVVESKKKYSSFTATYARSKLANVMHAVALTKRLRTTDPTTKITVNACHPGVVYTELSRNFFIMKLDIVRKLSHPIQWFFFKTDQDGAQTPLFLALSKKVDGISGKYFDEMKETDVHPLAKDEAACDALYAYSRKAVGLSSTE